MNSLHKSKKFGKRGIISFYKVLLKKGVIKKNGAAYNRMLQLKTMYSREKLD
tara:strand:+ start:405 stop:560 length:156 start_codon:yes stop_codon:yes gene_type:complete